MAVKKTARQLTEQDVKSALQEQKKVREDEGRKIDERREKTEAKQQESK